MAGRETRAGHAADQADVPPGHNTNPSEFRTRARVVVLALFGCAVATYLALFQYHVLHSVWDPFFGDGSRKVLTSPISRMLPVSDAALGATAYLFEAVLDLIGGRTRWRDQPWAVLLLGVTATGLALTGVALVISQPLLTGTFCTLCLVSAAVSWVVLLLAAEEVLATVRYLRQQRHAGRPLRKTIKGHD